MPIARLSPLLVLLLLLPGCFMPGAVANRVQNRWEDAREAEVDNQIRSILQMGSQRGWRAVGEHRGYISEEWNTNDEPRFTLPASGPYTMMAVCDANCNDVDLVVMTRERIRLGADFEPDDNPLVEFTGNRGDVVLGRVTIPGCAVDRCAYGVILLGR